jgi:hypothetical protein
MKKISEQLVTVLQLEIIFKAWKVTASIPKKGYKEIICFPCNEFAEVTYTMNKSENNKRLYKIEFYAN